MPRNGSSVYSLPAGNPVVPGTVIATTWANTTLTDIATALTNSLSTDGSTATVSMSGKTLANGLYSFPAVSGTLNLVGGNILFPTVQIPSANPNMLDDYEEGTWTPVLSFATPGNSVINFGAQSGWYNKTGNIVTMTWVITTTTFTHTTATGALQVTGLPFLPADFSVGNIRIDGVILTPTTTYDTLTANVFNSLGVINFMANNVNSGAQYTMASANHNTGVNITCVGTITYRTV